MMPFWSPKQKEPSVKMGWSCWMELNPAFMLLLEMRHDWVSLLRLLAH